ncbi:uncharacterized protein AAES06_004572 [Glossophaga mutica]
MCLCIQLLGRRTRMTLWLRQCATIRPGLHVHLMTGGFAPESGRGREAIDWLPLVCAWTGDRAHNVGLVIRGMWKKYPLEKDPGVAMRTQGLLRCTESTGASEVFEGGEVLQMASVISDGETAGGTIFRSSKPMFPNPPALPDMLCGTPGPSAPPCGSPSAGYILLYPRHC